MSLNRIKYIILLLGVVFSTLCAQNKQDYHWVMGYNGQNPHPDQGGTDWIFSEDSLRSVRVERSANFYVTDVSIADRTSGDLLLYSNGCAIYDNSNKMIIQGDSINYGDIWNEHCPAVGYPNVNSALMFDYSHRSHFIHSRIDYFPVRGVTVGAKKLFYSRIKYDKDAESYSTDARDSLILDTMISNSHIKSVRHADQSSWWVIQPGRYDNRYFTIKIDEYGIDTLFVQKVTEGNIGSGGDGGGQAVFSPDGQKYARFDIVENGVTIFDFDRTTGLLTNATKYHVNDETGGITGGCAFSPNSRFLYVSALSKVYQYDLWDSDIQASQTLIAEWDGYLDPFPTNFYLCNLGPDCRIYINSTSGVKSMHVIQHPDRKGVACGLIQHAIHLPTYNFASMPNFPHYRMDEDWPCDSTIGVKLTTSISLPKERVEFQISPNPASDILRLEYDLVGLDKLRFELYDISGMMVRFTECTYREFSQELDISDLPGGIYPWRLFNEEGAFTSGKVVIE